MTDPYNAEQPPSSQPPYPQQGYPPPGYPPPGYPPPDPYGQYPQGPPGYYPQAMPRPGFNGMAITGFVLSFLCALLGLIFSIIGLNQTKSSGQRGRGLALAGLIISIVNAVAGVLIFANR